MEDLSASRLCQDPPSQPDELVDCYKTTLAELLDRYAPLKTKTVYQCLGTQMKSTKPREGVGVPKGDGGQLGLPMTSTQLKETKIM